VLFMALAGINTLVFYSTGLFEDMKSLSPGARVPLITKIVAGTSLSMCLAVPAGGRLVAFYRPPFFH
jgi:hypothetical protein